ncbi:MAG: MFS transporter [Bdellovibrionota bacterium]
MNKKIFSWALYDWANSVFYTTVMAGFFPVFFKQYWSSESDATLSTARLGVILAVSGFLLALLSPTLGVVSDKKRMKKTLLFAAMIMGVLCTIGLYFVPQGDWSSAAMLYGTALFMGSASAVFYDSLLISVCREDQYDFVSSLGYSLGYLGGGILFLVNVIMVLKPEWFGLVDKAQAIKVSFLMVGAWWLIFTIPLMLNVPEPKTEISNKGIVALTKETIKELKLMFMDIRMNKNLFYFIVGYWFYIDGIYTVMTMAVDFGLSLGLDSSDLMKALLITQFVGFPSAYLFGTMSKKFGSKHLILIGLAIYFFTIIGASQMSEAWHFYVMAFIIGLCQGGVQALSRALYAHLIPTEKSGEYFGFFNMLGKFASVLGPLLIALVAHLTSDSRKTILSLLVLIAVGAYFLLKVKVVKRA